jgi:hypothetical protein
MASFKLNPTTNKWEPITEKQKGDSDLKRIASNFGLSLQQVLYGTGKQEVAARKQYEKVTATSSTPYGVGQGSYGEVSMAEQPKERGREWIGRDPSANAPAPADVPMTPQDNIDAMWQSVYDEAQAYQQIYGEQPPSSWWDARTTPIENAQKRYDLTVKGTSGTSGTSGTKSGPSFADILASKKFEYEKGQDAAQAKIDAAALAKVETDRLDKIAGGKAGETYLREQAKTRKIDMLKRVAELYDPQQQATKDQLVEVLKNASAAFDLAEQQVGSAQEQYTKNFKGSTAYEGVPISTYSVADNPLLAALRSQGAGTGEVQAATDLARQTGQQTSDLEKYALAQLNTGQLNYGSAQQNAAQMGTMAALQQLGGRRAEVKSGINTQFAEQLAALGKERTAAESDVDTVINDIISRADEMAANTKVDEGKAPVVTAPVVTTPSKPDTPPPPPEQGQPAPAAKPKPKPVVTTPVVKPPVVEPVVPPKKKVSTSTIRRS